MSEIQVGEETFEVDAADVQTVSAEAIEAQPEAQKVETPVAVVTGEAPKPKTFDIIRGRMPHALVWMVRYEDKNLAVKELAAKYGTTVGKITDILKVSNFAYINANWKPTREQKDLGIAWLKRHPGYDELNVDALVDRCDKLEEATPEQAAAQSTEKAEAKGQDPVTKDGEVANGGGGNRIKGGKKKEPVEHGPQPSAEELLA